MFELKGFKGDEYIEELGKTIGEELLTPTRLYPRVCLPLIRDFNLHGMAHITGGGITENLNRALPKTLDAVVDRGGADGPAWDVPPVIDYCVKAAGLTPDEAYKTFNMGVGMSILCAQDDLDEVCEDLEAEGLHPFVMGEVTEGTGKVVYR